MMTCPLTKQEFDRAYGSKTGDPNYDPRADMNKDGVVNFDDFTMFAACYSPPTTPPIVPPSTPTTDKEQLTIVIVVIIIVLLGIFLLKK